MKGENSAKGGSALGGKKGNVAVIVIIIAVAVLAAGIISWKFAKKTPAPVETKTTVQSVSQNKVTDETADWQTYRNEKYGFEIKYPSNLETIQNSENSISIVQNDVGEMWIYNIDVSDIPSSSSLEEVFNKRLSELSLNDEAVNIIKYEIDGRTAMGYNLKNNEGCCTFFMVIKNGKLFAITGHSRNLGGDFKFFINSFKFIN